MTITDFSVSPLPYSQGSHSFPCSTHRLSHLAGVNIELPADVFFPDAFHRCYRIPDRLLSSSCQRDHLFVYCKTFEKFRMGSLFLSGAWLFAAVLFRKERILFRLCLIEQVELSRNVKRCLFTGSAEKLLCQIVHLFLQHCSWAVFSSITVLRERISSVCSASLSSVVKRYPAALAAECPLHWKPRFFSLVLIPLLYQKKQAS